MSKSGHCRNITKNLESVMLTSFHDNTQIEKVLRQKSKT